MSTPAFSEVEGITVDRNVAVTMRDGVEIKLDVYRPVGIETGPVLYAVSPYQKDFAHLPPWTAYRWRETGNIDWWVKRGYTYVLADARGSGQSKQGLWRHMAMDEQTDTYDTIEWIAEQGWSDGKVGMIGESYFGVIQWLAAAQQPPHLTCIAPYDALVDMYRDLYFHGGIPVMGFNNWWCWDVRARMLLEQPDECDDQMMSYDFIGGILRHGLDGPYWHERSAYPKFADIKVPFYSISNWTMAGIHLRGNLLAFEEIDAPKKLMLWGGLTGGDTQAAYHSDEMQTELARWYDYWLKGEDTGIMGEPPIKIFVQGTNVDRTEHEWPLRRTRWKELYLAPGPSGLYDSLNDGTLSFDGPPEMAEPVELHYPDEAWGGWPMFGPAVRTGVTRQGLLADPLKKILTFTSPPLEDDLEVTGPIVLHLWASSDQADTDFYAKIVDVYGPEPGQAEGMEMNVSKGWLRASHRALDEAKSKPYRPFHTHVDPEPITPGEVYAFAIEVMPTSRVFAKGHRIRLQIAPADSPLLDVPLNHHFGMRMGVDTIYHDALRPSHLLLPVIE
jgi:hypothetical protein